VRVTVAGMKANLGVAGVLATATILFASTDANAADHANGFGEKGQLLLSADRFVPVFNYASASITRTENGIEATDSRSGSGLSLLFGRSFADNQDFGVPINVHALPRVAFDVTIIPRLTLGGAIAFGFGLGGTNETETVAGSTKTTRKTDAPTGTAIGFAPRVGYILPLSDMFAFWPRAGLGIYSVSASTERVNNNNVITTTRMTDTLFSLDLDPQFAIVPLEHFFITVGPTVNIPITGSRSVSTTTGSSTVERTDDASVFNLGLNAGLGGWFNVF